LGALDAGLDEEDDVLGREMLERVALELGDVVEDEGRLVLGGLGGAEDMLYVAPTTTGHIAYAILPNGGGGCSAPGPDGLILSTVAHRHSVVVCGLVADPVVGVDVVVDHERRRARMGENGFGVRIDAAAASALEKLVLFREDGNANELDVRISDRGDS
jgi:hypothetical protein